MPARKLVHETQETFVADTWKRLSAVVVTARTKVGRLVVVPNSSSSSVTFSVSVGSAESAVGRIVSNMLLSPGDQFEQMVVVPEAKAINVVSNVANGVTATFMGEEVDN